MITIEFTIPINNDSLQIGDLAYFVTPSQSGGFNTSIDPTTGEDTIPKLLGPVMTITEDSIIVDETGNPAAASLSPNDFIMFAKDSIVNLSGLVGYYAEVTIKNNSKTNAEMFAIGSEISVSSK